MLFLICLQHQYISQCDEVTIVSTYYFANTAPDDFIKIIFLFAGLKYHDAAVNIKSNKEGNFSVIGSPSEMCENNAPDIIKKNPA